MTKLFTNNFSILNLHKKPSLQSEVVTQMLYGDSFSIIKKTKKWLKIKIKEDGYKGFIKNKNFSVFLKPSHKINVLKSNIYKNNNKKKIDEFPFGSKIKVEGKKGKFFKLCKSHKHELGSRQSAPTTYEINTIIWIYSRKAIMKLAKRIPRKTIIFKTAKERSIDIDNKNDINLINFYIKKNVKKI